MRLTGSRAYTRPILVPKMPSGLVEVMEGLTKDVLKNNPTDIYEFCANHMQKLLEIRDGKSTKMSLTLEEKIFNAQEKVRQRAEHRWQKYDKVMETEPTKDKTLPPDITTENIQSLNVAPVLQNTLKTPIHQDEVLAADSEVEISQDSYDKTENIDKSALNVKDDEKTYDTNFEDKTSVNFEKDGAIITPTIEIYDIKNDNAMENVTTIINPDHALSGENDGDKKNEIKEPSCEKESDNQLNTYDGKSENEYDINETQIELENENRNKKSIIELQNDNQSKDTISLKNEDNLPEYVTVMHNSKDQTKENENKETIAAIENERPNAEVEQIAHNETINKDDTSNEEQNMTSNNSVDLVHNIAAIKTSLGEANEEINHVSQNVQTNEVSSQENNIDLDRSTPEFPKVEIKIYSADNIEEIQGVTAEENDQSGIGDNLVALSESDNVIVPSQDHQEISAPHGDISEENICNSPKQTDDKKQLDILNAVHSESSASLLLNENNEIADTACNKTNEDSTVESVTVQDNKGFGLETNDKKDPIESYDIQENETYMENLDSKRDVNLEGEIVEESAPDTTLLNRSVSLEGNSGVKVDPSEYLASEKTQDEVNDHTNMNLETAAITIQKVFRNFLFKSRAESTFDDTANDDANVSDDDSDNKVESEFSMISSSLSKERRGLGITRMDTVLQTVNEEKSLSLSTDDSSTLSSAATIIQSHVRGFLVRNKLNSNRTVSTNSLVNSNPSLETDTEQIKNKTILNIHIVPEGSNLSRDESIITSMDLSLDGSPPSSINLHPLGYDKSERRKQLKREDAIQSISPPSNNSGKLSEDSVKDVIINEVTNHIADDTSATKSDPRSDTDIINHDDSTFSTGVISEITDQEHIDDSTSCPNCDSVIESKSLNKMSSDEMDVVTPFVPIEDKSSSIDIDNTSKLVFSGEFHDMVLPTQVSRSDTSVVRGE